MDDKKLHPAPPPWFEKYKTGEEDQWPAPPPVVQGVYTVFGREADAGTIIETNDKKLMDAGIPYLSTPGLSAKQEVRKLVRSLRMQYIRVLDELLKSPEGAFFGMGVMDNVSLGIKNIDIIVSNLYHHLDQLRNLDAQRQLKEHIQQTTAEREEMMREVGRLQAGGLREMLLRRR